MFRRRGNGSCSHTMCDIVARHKPERTIGFVCDQIVLFDHHFGRDYECEIREMALEAVARFGPGTPYQHDVRMLGIYRLLAKYSKTVGGSLLYEGLNDKQLFLTSPQFFVDWAAAYLAEGNVARASDIVQMAILQHGRGYAPLTAMRDTLMRAQAERFLADIVVEENDFSKPPPPLPAARALAEFSAAVPLIGLQPEEPLRAPLYARRVNDAATQTDEHFAQWPSTTSLGSVYGVPPSKSLWRQRTVSAPVDFDDDDATEDDGAWLNSLTSTAELKSDDDEFPDDFLLLPRSATRMTSSASATSQEEQPADEPVMPPALQRLLESAAAAEPQQELLRLPHLSETAPPTSDMISPSLAQMHPGRPNNFVMPPIFLFADYETTRGEQRQA